MQFYLILTDSNVRLVLFDWNFVVYWINLNWLEMQLFANGNRFKLIKLLYKLELVKIR